MQAPPATTVKMPQLQQQCSIRSPDDRIGSAFNYNDEGTLLVFLFFFVENIVCHAL